MGNRLSKIVTRTGDNGTTGLGDGSRTNKDSPRITALGEIDELNSAIGMLLAEEFPVMGAATQPADADSSQVQTPPLPDLREALLTAKPLATRLATPPLPDLREALLTVQHHLFDLGGEICIPGHQSITSAHIVQLENWVDAYNAHLPPLKEFILPGGSRPAALAHLARTVCRRVERAIVHLGQSEAVAEPARQYLNRLSDLLFVIGRTLNRCAGGGDILWQHTRDKSS